MKLLHEIIRYTYIDKFAMKLPCYTPLATQNAAQVLACYLVDCALVFTDKAISRRLGAVVGAVHGISVLETCKFLLH